MSERQAHGLQDILLQFSAEQGFPDAALLQRYVHRYPEHNRALTEFAASLVKDGLISPTGEATAKDDAIVLAAVDRYQAYLERSEQAPDVLVTLTRTVVNPIEKLNRERFSSLAQYLKVPLPFVAKLRDRAIQVESIPSAFIFRLASFLQLSESAIVAHLSAEPQLVGLAVMGVNGRKAEDRVSFTDGLRAVGLDSGQIKLLMNDLSSGS